MKATMILLSLFFVISFCLPGPNLKMRIQPNSLSENPFKDSLEREDMHCQFSNNFDLLFLSKPGAESRKVDSIVFNKIKNQRFGQHGILSLTKRNTIFMNELYMITAAWMENEPIAYWFIDCSANNNRTYSQSNLALSVKHKK